MKFLALISAAAAAIGSCQAAPSNRFHITNFVARHSPAGIDNSVVYFNVAFVNATGMETFQDRCYGDVKPGSETALGNLGGACQKEQYTWSLEKQPNGHYQLFIAYVDSSGRRDFPLTALTTYNTPVTLSTRSVKAEQLTPKNAASFFIGDQQS